MERRVTSPTWGPPPPCKQALRGVRLVKKSLAFIYAHNRQRLLIQKAIEQPRWRGIVDKDLFSIHQFGFKVTCYSMATANLGGWCFACPWWGKCNAIHAGPFHCVSKTISALISPRGFLQLAEVQIMSAPFLFHNCVRKCLAIQLFHMGKTPATVTERLTALQRGHQCSWFPPYSVKK